MESEDDNILYNGENYRSSNSDNENDNNVFVINDNRFPKE